MQWIKAKYEIHYAEQEHLLLCVTDWGTFVEGFMLNLASNHPFTSIVEDRFETVADAKAFLERQAGVGE